MLVTDETSHADKPELNNVAPENMRCMLVMADTFHDEIGPFKSSLQSPTGEIFTHSTMAVLRVSSVCGAKTAATNATKGFYFGVLSAMVRTRQ